MLQSEIRIDNARSHNLQGVSCRIPLGSLTVVTGVSGSGKSTLAFDTLYAEGQRRYITSLSTYARQFLERLPRPQVDGISRLPPAIAIEQRNRVTSARSTVGTASEILDHLRLLFAKIGGTRCLDCDRRVEPGTAGAVADRIARRWVGQRIHLAAPLIRHAGESARLLRERLVGAGLARVLDVAGEVLDLVEVADDELEPLCDRSLVLLDRLVLRDDRKSGAAVRLLEAVELAFAQGEGEVVVVDGSGERVRLCEGFACDGCGRRFPTPQPSLFSFNSPLGACSACQGFGRTAEIDLDRVVPEPERSLEEHAIAPFATPMGRALQRDLLAACRARGVPTDVPYRALDDEQRRFVQEGDGGEWYGVRGFFEWLESRRYKVQARVLIARYRRFVRCGECDGMRLCRDALAVELAGRNLGELSRLTVGQLLEWLSALKLDAGQRARAGRLLKTLLTRLATAEAVGLGYLGLDRQVRSLSGGEAQRIQLATALGGGLTAALYVLDEPSIGLHRRDMDRLLQVLLAIRDQGNTVVVVEHALEILSAADHVIDLGPGAGRNGGRLMVEGDLEQVKSQLDSQTGRLLRGEFEVAESVPARAGRARGVLRVSGARENNLRDLSLEIPLGCLVVVTGVSGAGKSTLVKSVVVGNLVSERTSARARGSHGKGPGRMPPRPLVGHARWRESPGACDSIEGAELLDAVVVADQTPAVRSPRSNPATVSKAFDGIRQCFAATRQAKALGVGPGWFSFNVAGGRCDTCEGAGEVVIDMQFLDDVRVPCDDCGGLRYRREVLEVQLAGRSIVDVLALTIDEAAEIFASERRVAARLEPFQKVGLGYLTLGQPLSTLSGGEHQRVRLALALSGREASALFVLDEPTTGLHAADVQVLLRCLDELIDGGGSVIVIEHNLDVIRRADFIIDLGPDGGPGGGRIVAMGTQDEVAQVPESHTGSALRDRRP